MRRAQRTGLGVEKFGDVANVDLLHRTAKVRVWFRRTRHVFRAAPYRKGWRDVLRRASSTRPRDLGGLVSWTLHGIGARLSEIWGRERERSPYSPPPGPGSRSPTPLGVEIVVLGAEAARIFAGCPAVTSSLSADHVDLVVADTPSEAKSLTAPAIVLSEARSLAVPAFDPTIHNPVGWTRDVGHLVGSLGTLQLLPRGIKVHRVVGHDDRDAVRLCHHLVDTAAFHSHEIKRAGVLVRLAATGALVHLVDGGPGLDSLIGNELHVLMTLGVQEADADERESRSIKMRRIALREHSFRSRARKMSEAVLDDPSSVPSVSILLATKRPNFLAWALDNVARQDYPRLQLVLALHGADFDAATVERHIAELSLPTRVIHVGESQALGTVLNSAVDEANGVLLTKMNDDGLYGRDHIWDLVLAHEYSGAQLVGKGLDTVYLADRDQTARRIRREGETYNRHVAGGTLLVSRHDLDRIGGWKRVPLGMDEVPANDVFRDKGSVYRTHGSGYVLVRYGTAHTRDTDDDSLSRDYAVLPGWQPGVAGIENGPELPSLFRPR